MAEYGVTDKGFVLKRMDVILGELHEELSAGFGFDTRMDPQSFLNVLITTFGGQAADLWETAQNSYYAKYPATAEGINLDNAVQYGGIRRQGNRKTFYPIHCSGDEGTAIREGTIIASSTMPKTLLMAATEFSITREGCNRLSIRIAAIEAGKYTISINGMPYSYIPEGPDTEPDILAGLRDAITNMEYEATVDTERMVLDIVDKVTARSNIVALSDNLTTASVTTIASFGTGSFGKIVLPNGTISEIITNIGGLNFVENLLEPTYGRLQETDVELRQSYLAKSAIRSTRMIDSIASQMLNNVANVESVVGYENPTDSTDGEGRPPHSIEFVVEGGSDSEIAGVILDNKAAGIQTHGLVEVQIPGRYGELIPVRFNRPQYIYVWIKVTLHGDSRYLPKNYVELTIGAVTGYGRKLVAGEGFIQQLSLENIYRVVAGITYVEMGIAATMDASCLPGDAEYTLVNIEATSRQKILISGTRIGVFFNGSL